MLAQVPDTARHAEAHGFFRYWVAEHHGMPGIASAATSIVIAQAGAATRTIRVGAGGIMLPNHAPLVIAEQFGTLDALFPGRVDLGSAGRPAPTCSSPAPSAETSPPAPTPSPKTSSSCRATSPTTHPRACARCRGPGRRSRCGSSARACSARSSPPRSACPTPSPRTSPPQALDAALATYRKRFEPSRFLDRPRVMVGFNVFAADTEQEAAFLASSAEQAFVAIRTGRPRALPLPVEGYRATLGPAENALLDQVLSCSAIGTEATVAQAIEAFLERTAADEIIFASMIADHEARKKSLAIAAQAMQAL